MTPDALRDMVREEVDAAIAERSKRADDVFDALYRAVIILGRALKPGKRWDGL